MRLHQNAVLYMVFYKKEGYKQHPTLQRSKQTSQISSYLKIPGQ